MDGHRFDEIARGLASGTSRRRVLGVFASGIAAIGAHLTIPKAAAGCTELGGECNSKDDLCCPGTHCENFQCVQDCGFIGDNCSIVDAGSKIFPCCVEGLICSNGICSEPEPECGDEGETCFDPRVTQAGGQFPCCNKGLECLDGICTGPQCPGEGEYCGPKSMECCADGLECIEDFCTVPEPQCIETGESCVADLAGESVCCDKGAECIDGICQVPIPECFEDGESCEFDADCCDDLVCLDDLTCGTIPEPDCIEEGESCEVDGDCCEGICCAGACRNIECCIDDENPNDRCDDGQSCFEGICEGVSDICESDDDCADDTCCCDDGSCDEDCCEVTALPNTGAGDNPSSKAGWFGAAALGAAAAFLGSKKLQPQEQPVNPNAE